MGYGQQQGNFENKGRLWPNGYKTEQKHPDFKGKLDVAGVPWEISGWWQVDKNGQQVLSLRVDKANANGQPKRFPDRQGGFQGGGRPQGGYQQRPQGPAPQQGGYQPPQRPQGQAPQQGGYAPRQGGYQPQQPPHEADEWGQEIPPPDME